MKRKMKRYGNNLLQMNLYLNEDNKEEVKKTQIKMTNWQLTEKRERENYAYKFYKKMLIVMTSSDGRSFLTFFFVECCSWFMTVFSPSTHCTKTVVFIISVAFSFPNKTPWPNRQIELRSYSSASQSNAGEWHAVRFI